MAFAAFADTSVRFQPRLDDHAARRRLDRLADLLDSAVRIPGTRIRVGADALLNLIPGLGAVASNGLSAYLIAEAARLGVPRHTLWRMIGNVAIDFVIGAVPIVGWIADVFFRANRRNLALLRKALDGEPRMFVSRLARRRGPVTDVEWVSVAGVKP